MKIHVRVDRRAAGDFRGQMDVADLLSLVIEVVAVDVEEGVKRDVEALTWDNLRHRYAVLPVDPDLDVFPGVVRAVVDGEALALKPKLIDVLGLPAPGGAQAQTRKRDGRREECAHGL
jgi:hypothetical protein